MRHPCWHRLHRTGCLRKGYAGGWQWNRDDEVVATIRFRFEGEALHLDLPIRSNGRSVPPRRTGPGRQSAPRLLASRNPFAICGRDGGTPVARERRKLAAILALQ